MIFNAAGDLISERKYAPILDIPDNISLHSTKRFVSFGPSVHNGPHLVEEQVNALRQATAIVYAIRFIRFDIRDLGTRSVNFLVTLSNFRVCELEEAGPKANPSFPQFAITNSVRITTHGISLTSRLAIGDKPYSLVVSQSEFGSAESTKRTIMSAYSPNTAIVLVR